MATVRSKLFAHLWRHYRGLVSDAKVIEDSLKARGESWIEDHIAFRALPGKHCGAHVLQELFELVGYVRQDDYHFEDKQLKAFWLSPPDTNGHSGEASPKIFVSELIPDRFSAPFREILRDRAAEVSCDPLVTVREWAACVQRGDQAAEASLADAIAAYLTAGPSWRRPTNADYEVLLKESEYAAWTLVFGSRVNHFTICAHLLSGFESLAALNNFIIGDLRIPMNTVGGLIKGNEELRLEQSATLAMHMPVMLQDGLRKLPYAFVEFAYRFPLHGRLADRRWDSYYQGFVTSNADKIFESTNVR